MNTMEHLKRGVKICDKGVFDLESIFLRLLVIGQQCEMELPIFGCELCAVPPSLMGDCGCVRRGNEAILVHKLGVKHPSLHALTSSSWTPNSSGITWSDPVGGVWVCWRSH